MKCENCDLSDNLNVDEVIQEAIDEYYNRLSDEDLLSSIDFSNREKCYDWKNYVGMYSKIWDQLTLRERKIIYIYASELANREEWN